MGVNSNGRVMRGNVLFGLREIAVLNKVQEGLTNKEISTLLGITMGYVRAIVFKVSRKIPVENVNRTKMAIWSYQNKDTDVECLYKKGKGVDVH